MALFFGEEALEAAAVAAGGVFCGCEGDGLGSDLELRNGGRIVRGSRSRGQDACAKRVVSRGEKCVEGGGGLGSAVLRSRCGCWG